MHWNSCISVLLECNTCIFSGMCVILYIFMLVSVSVILLHFFKIFLSYVSKVMGEGGEDSHTPHALLGYFRHLAQVTPTRKFFLYPACIEAYKTKIIPRDCIRKRNKHIDCVSLNLTTGEVAIEGRRTGGSKTDIVTSV